ncbi:2-(1,2-epoxy-1,2-dihydrophenyl)acetyl-CoA isomerase [Pseudomonas sp. ICMP22404]|uniref:enoyl-CoA hydratase-related protein n=1 Tax=Pseudomonas sp. ICMP22404 TaxID=2583807 RepID=UPI00111B0974|nr:enoyl-CoA hydratase-related protein [Pseudomonas sp. ICMP22404]TNF83382.1 2-(1,2-epoxy-1,2-dihydrophenyl)acetyl-CoA isomerase [Pseudomonas sp. ICMP22404]
MDYRSITLEITDGVARLTLNQPERLNSLSAEMNAQILHALLHCEASSEVRVLLIQAKGRGFCAGADLNQASMKGSAPDLGDVIQQQYNPIAEKLLSMAKPVVCAVNGVTAGAGVNFVLCCDIAVAAKSASFLQAFTKIGLMPDMGGTFFLPRLVGTARAMGLALLAERLSAEEAEKWGLIWKCVEDEQLPAEADAIARKLASMPPLALQMTKRALRESTQHSFVEQVTLERDLQRVLGFTQDFAEGANAFLEKRAPHFVGK